MCPCDIKLHNNETREILDQRETKASLKTCMTTPKQCAKKNLFLFWCFLLLKFKI